MDEPLDLRQYLERIMDERDRHYDTRFRAAETAVAAALAAQEKATAQNFAANEKAIVKAEDAQREYNVRSNEFRGQLDDQAKLLMPRSESNAVSKALEEKLSLVQAAMDAKLDRIVGGFEKSVEAINKDIASLRESRSESGGKSAGLGNAWAYLLGAVGLLATAASLLRR